MLSDMHSNSTGIRKIVDDIFWFIFPVMQLSELLHDKKLHVAVNKLIADMETHLTVDGDIVTSQFAYNGELNINKLCSKQFPRTPGSVANIGEELAEYFSPLTDLDLDSRAFLYYTNLNQTLSSRTYINFGTNNQALAYFLKFKYS